MTARLEWVRMTNPFGSGDKKAEETILDENDFLSALLNSPDTVVINGKRK